MPIVNAPSKVMDLFLARLRRIPSWTSGAPSMARRHDVATAPVGTPDERALTVSARQRHLGAVGARRLTVPNSTRSCRFARVSPGTLGRRTPLPVAPESSTRAPHGRGPSRRRLLSQAFKVIAQPQLARCEYIERREPRARHGTKTHIAPVSAWIHEGDFIGSLVFIDQ